MEAQGDRNSVLLVEDEVLVRLQIADDLRQAGFTVLEAANADEAVTVLDTHAEWVGLVVTDIQMPGSMDGLGLIQRVRERYPAIRVVVLSAANPATIQAARPDAIFSKPHEPAALIARIRQLRDGTNGNGARNRNVGRN